MSIRNFVWVLLCTSISRSQAFVISEAEAPTTSLPPTDLYFKAKLLQINLEGAVILEASSAVLEITEALSDMLVVTLNVTDRTDRYIQSEKIRLERELQNIKNEALVNGLDYDDCASGREDIVLGLPDNVGEEVHKCMSIFILNGTAAYELALNKTRAVQVAQDQWKIRILECNMDERCLLDLIDAMGVYIVEVPADLRENTDATVSLIRALNSQIETCTSDWEGSIEEMAAFVIQLIKDCLDL